MTTGFTRNAIKMRYVKIDKGDAYFDNMRTGTYRATGRDINGRRLARDYVVNQTDKNSPWPMWRDYNGRFGLTSLWHITDNGRILIHRKG